MTQAWSWLVKLAREVITEEVAALLLKDARFNSGDLESDHYHRRLVGSYHRDEGRVHLTMVCLGDAQVRLFDNKESCCVVRVLTGRVFAYVFGRNPSGNLIRYYSEEYGPGEQFKVEPRLVHQITNLSKSGSTLLYFHGEAKVAPARADFAVGAAT